jgi:hypothetical protein
MGKISGHPLPFVQAPGYEDVLRMPAHVDHVRADAKRWEGVRPRNGRHSLKLT